MCDRFPVNINPTISGADTGYNVAQELRLSHRVSRGAGPVSTLYRDDITWQYTVPTLGDVGQWLDDDTETRLLPVFRREHCLCLQFTATHENVKEKLRDLVLVNFQLRIYLLSLPQIHWLDFKFRFDTYYQWAALPSICPRNKSPKQKRFLKNIQFYIVMSWALGICARQSQDE